MQSCITEVKGRLKNFFDQVKRPFHMLELRKRVSQVSGRQVHIVKSGVSNLFADNLCNSPLKRVINTSVNFSL